VDAHGESDRDDVVMLDQCCKKCEKGCHFENLESMLYCKKWSKCSARNLEEHCFFMDPGKIFPFLN
jgi:hypothetical protein